MHQFFLYAENYNSNPQNYNFLLLLTISVDLLEGWRKVVLLEQESVSVILFTKRKKPKKWVLELITKFAIITDVCYTL